MRVDETGGVELARGDGIRYSYLSGTHLNETMCFDNSVNPVKISIFDGVGHSLNGISDPVGCYV